MKYSTYQLAGLFMDFILIPMTLLGGTIGSFTSCHFLASVFKALLMWLHLFTVRAFFACHPNFGMAAWALLDGFTRHPISRLYQREDTDRNTLIESIRVDLQFPELN